MHHEPHAHRDDILGILKRQEEIGEHLSEAEIGREIGLDGTQVSSVLRDLVAEGRVSRTASGNWELTPATAGSVQARPDPKEPQ